MFGWHERKRWRNVAERGIDFLGMPPAFDGPERVQFEDTRKDYGERRFVVLCPVRGRLFHVAYTMRGTNRRIISARKANKREQGTDERCRGGDAGGPHR